MRVYSNYYKKFHNYTKKISHPKLFTKYKDDKCII